LSSDRWGCSWMVIDQTGYDKSEYERQEAEKTGTRKASQETGWSSRSSEGRINTKQGGSSVVRPSLRGKGEYGKQSGVFRELVSVILEVGEAGKFSQPRWGLSMNRLRVRNRIPKRRKSRREKGYIQKNKPRGVGRNRERCFGKGRSNSKNSG